MGTAYARYTKPIDISKAQIQLLKQIDNYRNQQFIYNTIKPTLEKFAGKKVTKRLITALQKEYPKYHFYLRWVGTAQCYLEIKESQKNPPYNNISELSIFLGHIGAHSWAQKDNGRGYYTMDMIAEGNHWLVNIDKILQSSLIGLRLLKDNAERWNSLLERMQAIEAEMDKYEGLGTFFKFES